MTHPQTPEEYQSREEAYERGIFTGHQPRYQILLVVRTTVSLSEGAEPFAQDAEMLNKLAVAILPAATVECERLRYVEE